MSRYDTIRGVLLSALVLLPLLAFPVLAAEPPAAPSGICKTNEQCGKDEFCAKFFGSCEDSGKCEAKPQDCTERGKLLVKPVCGCDGKSYDNFCLAAVAGVNVKQEGKCAP